MTKILVIENDATQLNRLSFTLSQGGFSVESASCIISGLEKSKKETPDIILCSDSLPGLDPLDLLDLSKEEAQLADIPVIVFSEANHQKLDCFKAGCDDFIVLPADEGELEHRIKSVIRRGRTTGVNGNFSHIGIFDLIQLFMGARQSGVLEIDCGEISGQLVVEEGQVIHAAAELGGASLRGEDSFVELLKKAQKGGKFVFSKSTTAEYERNIEKRTDHLLLGIASMLDEA